MIFPLQLAGVFHGKDPDVLPAAPVQVPEDGLQLSMHASLMLVCQSHTPFVHVGSSSPCQLALEYLASLARPESLLVGDFAKNLS